MKSASVILSLSLALLLTQYGQTFAGDLSTNRFSARVQPHTVLQAGPPAAAEAPAQVGAAAARQQPGNGAGTGVSAAARNHVGAVECRKLFDASVSYYEEEFADPDSDPKHALARRNLPPECADAQSSESARQIERCGMGTHWVDGEGCTPD